jgi:hypothetical protein
MKTYSLRLDHITAIKVHVALLFQQGAGTPVAARILAQHGVDIAVALRVLADPTRGRPSIDPKLMARMLIVGYITGCAPGDSCVKK